MIIILAVGSSSLKYCSYMVLCLLENVKYKKGDLQVRIVVKTKRTCRSESSPDALCLGFLPVGGFVKQANIL